MGFALRRKNRALSLAPAPAAQARDVVNSPGRELDASARAAVEPRFGVDFSQVRVHTGAEAAASARALHANAFTVGRHVVFDDGKYDPHTAEGRHLLAHELAHTIQQNQASGPAGPLRLDSPGDAGEREADRAASAGAGPVAVNSRQPVGIQRQLTPGAPPHFDLAESASPMVARAIGSVTVHGFETGKSEISKSNHARLARTAGTIQTLLRQYPGSTIRVIGHTDAVGQESDNQALGQARADAVQADLASLGLPADAIQTESKGETQLLVKTKRAEPRNRRVEVRFEPNVNKYPSFIPDISLKPPTPPLGAGGFDYKPNLNLPPEYNIPPGMFSTQPSPYFTPIPPLPPSKSKPFTNPIQSFAESITSSLPKSVRGIAKDLVVGAISKGVTTGLDAGLEKAGVDQKSREAIGKAVEATIKQESEGKK